MQGGTPVDLLNHKLWGRALSSDLTSIQVILADENHWSKGMIIPLIQAPKPEIWKTIFLTYSQGHWSSSLFKLI